MKAKLNSTNIAIIAVVVLVACGVAFYSVALSPKREEAGRLDTQIEHAKGALAQHRAEIVSGEEARAEFPAEYQRLVVLGKAVPGDDDTASLLVQVNHIADHAKVRFGTLALGANAGSGGTETQPASASASGSPVSATEVAAATMPLGASVGPAGLAVMPYNLTFSGNFSKVADFIKGLDSLVETQSENVTVDGRLLTVNGFALQAAKAGFPRLEANFSVTTYLTPPGEAAVGGAAPESPAGSGAAPVSTTTGGVAR